MPEATGTFRLRFYAQQIVSAQTAKHAAPLRHAGEPITLGLLVTEPRYNEDYEFGEANLCFR